MKSDDVLIKAFNPAETNFTPGESSDVSWITTDIVDNEGEVVVVKGIDYQSVFMKNPVVMACHQLNRWPVGLCQWIKPAKGAGFTGLCAKTMYDEQDEDAVKLYGLVKRGLARGKSISFRPPTDFQPGDWGPPTPEELRSRPDWKGARRIIRRCVMFEYSVCPIPMNQEALTIAVSKGLALPSFLADLAVGTPPQPSIPELPPHRTLDQIEVDLVARLAAAFQPDQLAAKALQGAIDRARGVI